MIVALGQLAGAGLITKAELANGECIERGVTLSVHHRIFVVRRELGETEEDASVASSTESAASVAAAPAARAVGERNHRSLRRIERGRRYFPARVIGLR